MNNRILKRKEKYGPVYKMRAGFLVGVFLTRAQEIEVFKYDVNLRAIIL